MFLFVKLAESATGWFLSPASESVAGVRQTASYWLTLILWFWAETTSSLLMMVIKAIHYGNNVHQVWNAENCYKVSHLLACVLLIATTISILSCNHGSAPCLDLDD